MVDENTEKSSESPIEPPFDESANRPEEHRLKDELRGAVAKAVGIAVEAGSMLAGHSGEMVSAEGKVAESDTEEFIDRIDGEG